MPKTSKLKTLSHDNVTRLLESLGTRPTQIAHSLRKRNIKGVPGNCYECVLSRYVENKINVSEVSVHPTSGTIHLLGANRRQALTIEMPAPLTKFVDNFDDGHYTYLETER